MLPVPQGPGQSLADLSQEPSAVESIIRGETEIQAAIAHRFPRDPRRAYDRALAAATQTPETAAACFYALPRGGKTIEGPSVRLAEIIARLWGNMRAGSRIIGIDSKFVTAQAIAWDLESNYFFQSETRRRITDRAGRTFNDDMITVTANAAASIAYRKAVFNVVSKVAVDSIYQRCRMVAIGESRSLLDQWASAVAYWAKAGIGEDRLLAALGKAVEDITTDDIVALRGAATAIRTGETTIDETFPPLVQGEQKKTFGFKRKTEIVQSQPKPQPEPEPEAEAQPEIPHGQSMDDLLERPKVELSAICDRLEINRSGTKLEIAARIIDKLGQDNEPNNNGGQAEPTVTRSEFEIDPPEPSSEPGQGQFGFGG